MYSSWLQETRFSLQSIQVLEKAIISQMLSLKDNPKDRSIAQHRISNFAQMIQHKSKSALAYINQQSIMKNQQLASVSGQKGLTISSDNKKSSDVMWQNFYQKSRQIKQHYKRNQSNSNITNAENTVQFFRRVVFMAPFKQPEFSLQQGKGKYVDMHPVYLQYLNIYKVMEQKDTMKLHDYLWFLQNMDKFDDFSLGKKIKHQHKYLTYLNELIGYLGGFIKRSKPLFDFQGFMKNVQEQFVVKFQSGKISGWEPQNDTIVDDSQWQYCFYCDKLLLRNNAYIDHLSGKLHKKHLKANQGLNIQDPAIIKKSEELELKKKNEYKINHQNRKKEIALAEYKVMKMREQLANNIYDTMNLVRKKQTRGHEDIEDLLDEESSSEEADAPIYNPKNLPLGWDGKPIPYWLYKLHGLGIEYKCQICGNYSYWGRRAFQMHFQEWRHTYGMKCLKIPNTIHFKDVTTISDALALHGKLMHESQESQFRPDIEEEFEDKEGNILNRRTYLDMKKQGLLD